MILMKKIVTLLIASMMLTSASAVMAEDIAAVNENQTETEAAAENSKALNKYEGKIISYQKNMLSVEIDGLSYSFAAGENTPVYDIKTFEETEIKEGDSIIIFSTSPLLTKDIKPANAIVVIPEEQDEEAEGVQTTVIMDTFSKSEFGLISSDEELVLNVDEEKEDEYDGKTLLVFYNFATMSLPAQTNPEFAVVIDDEYEDDADDTEEPKENVEIEFAIGDSILSINGEDIEVETPYIAGDGVALVPLRVISEAFGAKVGWEEASRIVTIDYNDKSIILQIDNKISSVNGAAEELEEAPHLSENGFTMVPLRFISESLGADVSYDEETEEITVSLSAEISED